MLEKVICGFQTGADQAGARAAKRFGIPTGGWMPKGWLTEDGPRPEFAELYGAREHDSHQYPPRTRANINWCDGLILFGNAKSKGSRLAISIMNDLAVPTPYLVCGTGEMQLGRVRAMDPMWRPAEEVAEWLLKESVRVLNVAGNRESSAPGIGEWVEAYLCEVFRALGFTEQGGPTP